MHHKKHLRVHFGYDWLILIDALEMAAQTDTLTFHKCQVIIKRCHEEENPHCLMGLMEKKLYFDIYTIYAAHYSLQ